MIIRKVTTIKLFVISLCRFLFPEEYKATLESCILLKNLNAELKNTPSQPVLPLEFTKFGYIF
jgi:hypothetical protein